MNKIKEIIKKVVEIIDFSLRCNYYLCLVCNIILFICALIGILYVEQYKYKLLIAIYSVYIVTAISIILWIVETILISRNGIAKLLEVEWGTDLAVTKRVKEYLFGVLYTFVVSAVSIIRSFIAMGGDGHNLGDVWEKRAGFYLMTSTILPALIFSVRFHTWKSSLK